MCNNEINYSEKLNLSKDIVQYMDKIEWKYGVLVNDSSKENISTALYAKMKYSSNFGKGKLYHVYVVPRYFDSNDFKFYFSMDKEVLPSEWDYATTIADRAGLSDEESKEFIGTLKDRFVRTEQFKVRLA